MESMTDTEWIIIALMIPTPVYIYKHQKTFEKWF